MFDDYHGKRGDRYCGNQMCCWGKYGEKQKLPGSAAPKEGTGDASTD